MQAKQIRWVWGIRLHCCHAPAQASRHTDGVIKIKETATKNIEIIVCLVLFWWSIVSRCKCERTVTIVSVNWFAWGTFFFFFSQHYIFLVCFCTVPTLKKQQEQSSQKQDKGNFSFWRQSNLVIRSCEFSSSDKGPIWSVIIFGWYNWW